MIDTGKCIVCGNLNNIHDETYDGKCSECRKKKIVCKRCGHALANLPRDDREHEFCFECGSEFKSLVEELKVGFIADWDETKVAEAEKKKKDEENEKR